MEQAVETGKLFPVLAKLAQSYDFFEFRRMKRSHETLSVRKGHTEPFEILEDEGFMVTLHKAGASAYAASAELTPRGVEKAFAAAKARLEATQQWQLFDFPSALRSRQQGNFQSLVSQDWQSVRLGHKIELLQSLNQRLARGDERIIDYAASLQHRLWNIEYRDSLGSQVKQSIAMLIPFLQATAHEGKNTETRTFGGYAVGRQGGFEVLESLSFAEQADRVHEEALTLLHAPNCPTETCDLILAPDQMTLQIHESIGHPLELDRILGDERNYAGTSFVTKEMFGHYQYGSELLNVVFDPLQKGELASFAFDDTGHQAEKTYLIQKGRLLAGIGGKLSQWRLGVPGSASTRAVSWDRPPIDRMGNLNIEPGDTSLSDMIAGVERGILMKTNCSWSIDDSRNKFQFGCEWGQLIEKGKLTTIVKKPNYRGISAHFWRNLKAVGNRESWDMMGTPNCGKGEPNQAITVGHASPACLFADIQIFGGEET